MPNKIPRIPSLVVLLAAAFMLSVPLAPNAAAYRDVCVYFQFGVGYHGQFRLEYGDDPEAMRDAEWVNKRFTLPGSQRLLTRREIPARERSHWTGNITVFKHGCLSLANTREGEHFAVLVRAHGIDNKTYRYCRGWDNNPMVFYQNPRDTRRLMLHAWGDMTSPECAARWVR